MKPQRKNRRIAKVYENQARNGNTFLSLSVSKPYQNDKGKVFGGRLLFEDAETGELFEVKSASIFPTQDEAEKAVFEIVLDLLNDYQVSKLG